MDASVKQMLSSYEGAFTMYKEKLGPDNPLVKEACAAFAALQAIGDKSQDLMDFYAKAGERMGKISEYLTALAKEKPIRGMRTVPTSSQAAAGYHLAFDSAKDAMDPDTKKVYERIFALEKESENAAVFTRRLAEENLYLELSRRPLLSAQKKPLDNAVSLSQPVMRFYHEAMLASMAAARTIIEVEYAANLHAETSIRGNLYDTCLTNLAIGLWGNAITSWMLNPREENRFEVESRARFVAEFFAFDFDGLLAAPRLRDYYERILYKTVKRDVAAKGIASFEAFLESFRQVIATCLKGKPPVVLGPESNKAVAFGGENVPLDKIEQAYRESYREESPGV